MKDLLQGMNIYLIGMMGVGKTTIGKLLARELSYRFFDTDTLLERVTNQTIPEIFAKDGEEGFRDLESKVLGELAAYARSVIATGGGIVLRQMNWSYLQEGLIIWLDAPVDILSQRLRDDNTRPLLQTAEDLNAKLTNLLEQRKSLYAQADLHITIANGQTTEEIVADIIHKIPTVLINTQN